MNGTAATLKSFSVDDLRAFYAAAFQPGHSSLLVIGDVTMDRALPMLEASFGGWKAQGSASAPATMPAVPDITTRTLYLVDKPGAPQSQIRIGWVGVPRSTPDYFPIQVMNTILGGSFASRLNMNLREKNGYTYGASSGFDMRASAGPFVATAGVQTDRAAVVCNGAFIRCLAKLLAAPLPGAPGGQPGGHPHPPAPMGIVIR